MQAPRVVDSCVNLSASPVSILSFFFPQTVIVVRGESILNLKNSTDWFYSILGDNNTTIYHSLDRECTV